jgi:catechol 2,3-dioxygenase-like lactoylglutathione lyase family enzyme
VPRTGFIDHIGIGVPDLAAAKRYYGELMPLLGLRQWHGIGLQHLAFMVESRAIVREAHAWAVARGDQIVDSPRDHPEYGQHYAAYWLDSHGIMLEAVSFEPPD